MKILNELKAEVILKDTTILNQVQKLKSLLTYESEGTVYSFEDYFQTLNKEIKSIEHIELLAAVPPGGAQSYLVELSMALQMVTDKIEMAQTKAIYFQGKLKSALHVKDNLLATFSAWYLIAIAEKLKEAELKIPASTQKALAESEFSRLLEDVDINIEGLLSAVEVMVTHLKEMRKIAQEKYKLGTDQANASIVNLPFNGHKDGGESLNQFPLLKQRWSVTESAPVPDDDKADWDDWDEPNPILNPSPQTVDEDYQEPVIEDEPAYIQKREAPEAFEIPEGIHKIINAPVEQAVVEDEVSAEDLTASIARFREMASESPESSQPESEEPYSETVTVAGMDVGLSDSSSLVIIKDGIVEDSFAGAVSIKEGKATLLPLSKKTQKKIDFDEDDELEVVVKPPKKTLKFEEEEEEEITPEKKPETKKKKIISFDDDDAF